MLEFFVIVAVVVVAVVGTILWSRRPTALAPEPPISFDPPTRKEQLNRVVSNQAVTMDGKELTVLASIELYELYQRNGSSAWVRRGKSSKGLYLAGDVWILRVPSKEGGKYSWLKLTSLTTDTNLRSFYKGGDSQDTWGPARRFARSGQESPVSYQLDGKEWRVVDIGTFEAEVDGKCEAIQSNDRMYFVTSRGEGESWLIYLDARPGEASGTGTLLTGVAFEPDEAIEELL